MRDVPAELLASAEVPTLIRYALGDWLMIAAVWLAAAYAPSLYPVWVVLLAGRIHALGVVLHDAVHLHQQQDIRLRMLEVLAGYPVGSTIEAMRYHHLRHHRENGLMHDPYFKAWIANSAARFWLTSLRYFLLPPFVDSSGLVWRSGRVPAGFTQ